MTEINLHSLCFIWFHNTYPEHRQMLFHVNNKARNAIEGNRFKAMGVVKGVSDLVLILPKKVVFLELKTETGIQSPEQKEFEKKVTARGHEYIIIRSLPQFQGLALNLLT